MNAISFQSVSKAYTSSRGSGSFLALDQVSLEIAQGEFFGLLGPNGAGKTTLISILAGLTRATSGRVAVLGSDVQTHAAQARRKLGVVPQELVFDPFFNVREALRFQSGYFGITHNDAWIDELLASLGLADKADAYPRDLSVGERQRVALAAVTVTRPGALLLDEPTRGLDYGAKRGLEQLLAEWRDDGMAILVVTHDVELAAAIADRVVLMSQGEIIAQGAPAEVLGASPLFAPQIAKLFPETGWLTVDDVLGAS